MAMKRTLEGGILAMKRVKEILRLYEIEGMKQREIHRATGIARSCIQRYLLLAASRGINYQQASQLSDEELSKQLCRQRPGRIAKEPALAPDYNQVHKELLRHKGITLKLLWMQWIDRVGAGDSYCYETFCRHYQEWSAKEKVTMRHHYAPGEKQLSDYVGASLSFKDPEGVEHKVEVFVSTLGFSNLIYAEATHSQRVIDWTSSHIRAFAFFGGVAQAVVVDNLKSGVIRANRYEPELQQTFEELGKHYSTAILPTRAAKPRDKAKVEQAVQMVERWIVAPLLSNTYGSLEEINAAIKPLLLALNRRPMKDYGASREQLFEQEEKAALRPLPAHSFIVGYWKRARVHCKDYHIQIEQHWYSVPHHLVGKEVWVKVSDALVEIFLGSERVAAHKKSARRGRFSTIYSHMPQRHCAYRSERNRDSFINWALSIGPETRKQVEAIFTCPKHQEQAFRSILGLQRLAKTHGASVLELGCTRANRARCASYSFVKRCIELNQIDSNTKPTTPSTHNNIRGAGYYH